MPQIHKTKAMALTAGAAFPLCFIDPTGASQVVFFTSTFGAGTGFTVHAGQSIRKRIQKLRSSTGPGRSNAAYQLSIESTGELPKLDLRAFEECIRKLAASMTGVAVSGTLSLALPHYLVGFLLNGGEVAYQLRKLRKMRDACGGTKQLMENVSKFDMPLQVSAGVCIKFLTTVLFLGALEFDTFVDSIAHTSDGLMSLMDDGGLHGTAGTAAEVADSLGAAHDNLLDHDLLSATTGLAEAPTEAASQMLGYGANYTPTWTDNAPVSHWAAIGMVSTAAETGLARIVEEPIHKAINAAAMAGAKVGSSIHGHHGDM